jgi:HPt (histidine-containing phosphotransfer) domain-containing protein
MNPLPPVDLDQALRRLNGKLHIYERLLQQFRTDFTDYAARVASLLDEGKLLDARRATHVLKGASGNLSASRVFAEAARVEEALSHPEPDARASLDALDEALREFDAFVASFLATAADRHPNRSRKSG